MPRKGNRRKKTRTHDANSVPQGAVSYSEEFKERKEVDDSIPRSIVAKSSKVAPMVGSLVKDIRKMMGPYTASHLRERNYNRLKDFAGIAGHLGVSHLLMVSQTERNIVLRIARAKTGPTVHFRVKEYSLARQVRALQKRPMESTAAYSTPPLVVLNNFGSAETQQGMQHLKLTRIMLQNMLPSIDVKTIRLSECRRVVLFHYIKENDQVEVRHFAIRAQPVGISRSVKRIIQNKLPNLGELKDISEFIEGNLGCGAVSDSEAEEVGARVELSEKYRGRGNGATQQSAMKLAELGPRLTLEVFKVERGVGEGDILYHKFQSRTAEETAKQKAKIEKARLLKEKRRKEQEANVERKKAENEAKRVERVEKRKTKEEARARGELGDKRNRDEDPNDYDGDDNDDDSDDEDDDDIDYSDVDDGESSVEEEDDDDLD